MNRNILLLSVFLILSSCSNNTDKLFVAQAPAGEEYTKMDTVGITVIPNGRLVQPAGKSYRVAPHPFGLALSHDGTIAITANSGTSPLSVSILKDIHTGDPEISQIPDGYSTDKGVLASVFMGIAISPDNQTIYAAGGQANRIYLFDLDTRESKGYINCADEVNGVDYTHGYLGDLKINESGDRLYVVDQINFIMLEIDLIEKKVLSRVPTGRYPFGICLSPDENRVYVANVGMFEYSRVASINPDSIDQTSLEYPAFAYNSIEARDGIHNDSIDIPGLGDPNVPESFSVWTIDLNVDGGPLVVAKTKTGRLVGELVEDIPAVGGASPNSLVATDKYVFVSNGSNDNISVIDPRVDTVVATIHLPLDSRLDKFRGMIPFGLAVSPDQKRLYVAESGINAIGVIDLDKLELIGHIPAGWFPSKLAVTPDGQNLIVANAKGFGSGPNGGKTFVKGPEGSYIGSLMKGSVSVIPVPSDRQLKEYSKNVVRNNFDIKAVDDPVFDWRSTNPIPLYAGHKESPIKYIVFVSKENRTYDEIFGQVPGGKGDSGIARYGMHVDVHNPYGEIIKDVTITPNHLALAANFGMGDNFYVDSDVSADGHRWLANTYPNEWVEATTPANYGGNRSYRSTSKSPGALSFTGAAGAIYPEDYNEAGSMWDHLERHGISLFNFGFGTMFEPGSYKQEYKYSGIRHIANYPMPAPIYSRTSRLYPTYNMAIPDQFRIDMFIREYNDRWSEGKEELPGLMTIIVPNDHGAGNRPEAGYPVRESYMMDNDLAIGRLVEFLSHTPYWKNMAIVITEDDAQGGVDHVDAHRSILLVISPYAKKNYVSHTHYSFGSLFKTFWNILNIPTLNQYDTGATDLADFFQSEPDYSPFMAVSPDLRIFDPQKALSPFDENFDWKALEESPEIDKIEDMLRESKELDEWRKENK
ncbi:MAG: bifunctional YncE family protein/alkaline phosphatase family protein [Bacteroidales bacterium]|nr:bifunctional YncE family protein/alkaline phosphatase family protein [Bacteroidales bacterium]